MAHLLRTVGGELYFIGGPSSRFTPTLYRTDGTAAGTVAIRENVSYGGDYRNLLYSLEAGGALFLSDGDSLWRSDGTKAGTIPVGGVGSQSPYAQASQPAVALTGGVLFSSKLNNDGRELRFAAAIAPAAPDGLTATVPGGVQLTWADHASNESGFAVERSATPGFATVNAGFFVAADVTSFYDPTGTADFFYRVRAVNAAGSSAFSAAVQPIDTFPPSVTLGTFDYQKSQRVTLRFNENVAEVIASAVVTVESVPAGAVSQRLTYVGFDAATNTATFAMPSRLPDGNYRATLSTTGMHDRAGNSMASPFSLEFFVLYGDADHDRTVGQSDFNLLASHFGKKNQTFATGDFDYDGVVGPADFNLLASRFGTTLACTAAAGRGVEHVNAYQIEAGCSEPARFPYPSAQDVKSRICLQDHGLKRLCWTSKRFPFDFTKRSTIVCASWAA